MAGRDPDAPRGDPLRSGPWLSEEAMAALPNARRDFDLNRDPLVRRQLLDAHRSEAQRRGDGSGRGSGMVERDKPNPHPRPPAETGRAVDRTAFSLRWLVEQRDAALAGAAPRQGPANDTPVRSRGLGAPSR